MHPGRVAVVPDRHGAGTNALLMSPPDAIAPGFGPGSRERHTTRAERARHEVAVETLASLALDVDTPEDLEAMVAVLEANPDRAPATAQALVDLGQLAAGVRE
jgi:2-phospho-L-lactate guanylyltransferase